MGLNERQSKIFALVCDREKITVGELSRILYVSEMTVRRDLTEMERGGYVRRYRGGAISLPQGESAPLSQRLFVDKEEKRALAKAAARYLSDGICVFIDSSSSAQFVIPYLKCYEGIRLVSNSVSAVNTAAAYHIPCFLIGGEYVEHEACCIGATALACAEKINVDVAFLSTLGIREDGAITDSSPDVTAVKQAIMKNARHTVFLFEKAKLGKVGLYTLCYKDDEGITVLLP